MSKLFLKYQFLFIAGAVIVFETILVLTQHQPLSFWLEYWWMFPIAFLVALTVNTAGISGAALFVPFFILIFPLLAQIHLLPLDTVRLGLITESFGLSSSALAFLAFGLVDVRIALRTILWALPFVVLGVFFTFAIPEAILYIVIAIMLISATLLLYFKEHLARKRITEHAMQHVKYMSNDPRAKHITRTSIDGKKYTYCITPEGKRKRTLGYTVGGFFQGAAGFGIGELGIIAMILTHIPVRIAIGTSHLIVASTAIIASLIHFSFAPSLPPDYLFPWNIVAMTVPAVILGGQLAPFVAAKIPSKHLEHFIGWLFVVIAIALIILALTTYS